MTKATKNYKELLLEARNLRGKAGENAWKRATILVQVFEDQAFRDSIGAADDWRAAEMLNAEVEDLCLTFLQLREMLSVFPQRKQWEDGRMRTLYEQARDRSTVEDEEKPKRQVTRISKKEFEQEHQARVEAEARFKYSDKQRAELLHEIEELKAENNQLRGRISELERLLSGKGAMASV